MAFGSVLSFGGLTINIGTVDLNYSPHTSKQTIGKKMTSVEVLGTTTLDRVLSIRGYFSGSTRFTSKTSLLALDDGTYHAYTDGEHDGSYVLPPGSLKVSHDGNDPGKINVAMTLVEW